ncbi:hypothetical protein ACFVQB_27790 [Paenibacillus sp. NPDC057886]|uniref:hypothetical protein n=1 Tax=Paenibacillus sp. NPDC057886 TaxID=3346270 RepID=UPI0036C245DF
MYNEISSDEIRSICRQQLEMFEFWSKRLIHDKFSTTYGSEYITHRFSDDNYLFNKSIREGVIKRFESKPGRYSRFVDALLIDDIVTILSNPKFYKDLFYEPLNEAYPDGNVVVRTFLGRLIPIRNNLSHANPISIRSAEQVICYTNDFIDSLKNYYVRENIAMQYNVPLITRAVDSKGNELYRYNHNDPGSGMRWDLTKDTRNYLRPGDSFQVEVEVDPSFDINEYSIIWKINHIEMKRFKNKNIFNLRILDEHVSINLPIECEIVSNKKWHKYNHYDDCLNIYLRVLPPL